MLFCCTAVLLQAGCAHYTPKPLSLAETSTAFDSRSLTNADVQTFVRRYVPDDEQTIRRWDLERLVLAAFFYNPTLQLARTQQSVAQGAQLTAAARPNPAVGFSPGYDFNAISPASPWIPGMTVDYLVETSGKRRKRMLEAQFNEEASRLDVAATTWQVRSNVHLALIELSAARTREALIAQQLKNQTALAELLQQRLQAGAATRFEVAPFELAVLRGQSDLATARAAAVQGRAHLAEAIGLPAHALETESIDFPIPRMITLRTNLLDLRANALQHRADLLALLARYEAAQVALQLEIARQYPDVRLGSGYQWDQGESKWNLSLNFEIPIFNRNQGPIAEAEARRNEVAAQVIDVQARIIHQIDRAAATLTTARDEAARAAQALGALAEQVRLVQERLAAGGADQVEVQTALLEEHTASLLAFEAQVRAATAAAELQAALQTSSAAEDTFAPSFSSTQ